MKKLNKRFDKIILSLQSIKMLNKEIESLEDCNFKQQFIEGHEKNIILLCDQIDFLLDQFDLINQDAVNKIKNENS